MSYLFQVVCLRSEGTKGSLMVGSIYQVESECEHHYTLKGLQGHFDSSRFKVLEEPKIDNTLRSPLIDEHNRKLHNGENP